MTSTIRTIAIAITTAVVAVILYSQASNYFEEKKKLAEQREVIAKSVAEATEGASEMLRFESNPKGITFGEIFTRGESRIEKISDAVIPIGISSLPKEEKDALKAYMDALQEILRLQVAANRKTMAVSSAMDIARKATNDIKNSSYYGLEFASKRATETLDDAKKAMEESSLANHDFLSRLKALRKTVETLRPAIKSYALVDDGLLVTLIAKVEERSK